jgi:small subunit ribosomal protein S20
MPIIKSAIKAMKQNTVARERNRLTKADFKSKLKIVRKDIGEGGKNAEKLLASAVQAIDKAAKKGVLHKKAASRRKARLMLAANKASGKPVVVKAVKVKTDKPIVKKTPAKKAVATTKKKTTTKKEA